MLETWLPLLPKNRMKLYSVCSKPKLWSSISAIRRLHTSQFIQLVNARPQHSCSPWGTRYSQGCREIEQLWNTMCEYWPSTATHFDHYQVTRRPSNLLVLISSLCWWWIFLLSHPLEAASLQLNHWTPPQLSENPEGTFSNFPKLEMILLDRVSTN